MTLDQFITKYNGKGVDFDGHYGDQCVDLFRAYNKEVLGISQPKGVEGAKDFWTNYESDTNLKNNFKKIPDSKELVPLKGDVMIWGAKYGKFGHIAIVTKGTINDFTCFSQNDPIGAKSIIKHYPNFNGVLGVLRPLQTTNETMIELPKEKFEELVTKATAYDQITNLGYDLEKIKELISNLNKLNQEKTNLEFDLKNEVQLHKECALELLNLKEKYDQLLNQPNSEVDELLQKITTLENSVAGFKGEITKKDKQILELQATIESLESLLSVSIVGILNKILTKLKGLIK